MVLFETSSCMVKSQPAGYRLGSILLGEQILDIVIVVMTMVVSSIIDKGVEETWLSTRFRNSV